MNYDDPMLHFDLSCPGEPTYAAPIVTSPVASLSFEEREPTRYTLSAIRAEHPKFSELIDSFLNWYDSTDETSPTKSLTIPLCYFGEQFERPDAAESLIAVFLPPELEEFGAQFAAYGTDLLPLGPLDLSGTIAYMHWCVWTDSASYLSLLVRADAFHDIYSKACFDYHTNHEVWIPVLFIGSDFAYVTGVKVDQELSMAVSHNSLSSPPYLGFSREIVQDGLRKAKLAGSTTPWAKGYWSEREGHTVVQAGPFNIGEPPR